MWLYSFYLQVVKDDLMDTEVTASEQKLYKQTNFEVVYLQVLSY